MMQSSELWKHVECIDMGRPISQCQICGTAIRYVHVLLNDDGRKIHIGCECSDRILSGEMLEKVRKEDKAMKSRAQKIERLRVKWKERNDFYAQKNPAGLISWELYLSMHIEKGLI